MNGSKNFESKKVSVVIPFYNNIEWLCEAVESVFNQTYNDYEILIVNDGSTENDKFFLEKYGNRVLYFKTLNKGPGAARNFGIEKAKGKYIAFLDSDDLWLSDKLEQQVRLMDDKNLIWSHCSYSLFNDKTNKHIKDVLVGKFSGDVFLKKFISSPIGTPCVIVKRDLFLEDKSMRFAENLRYGQDSYLWGLISEKYPLIALNKVLVKVRIRGSNAGGRARVQLQTRSNTYEKIREKRENKEVRYLKFPFFPFFLFKLAFYNHKVIEFLEKRLNLNTDTSETISKLLYAPIYIGFKTYNLFI